MPKHQMAMLLFVSFLVVQQLNKSSCFFLVFGWYVPFCPHRILQDHIRTHKPDQTKININGFNLAISAALRSRTCLKNQGYLIYISST